MPQFAGEIGHCALIPYSLVSYIAKLFAPTNWMDLCILSLWDDQGRKVCRYVYKSVHAIVLVKVIKSTPVNSLEWCINAVHSPCDIHVVLPLIMVTMYIPLIEVEVTINLLVVMGFGRCTGSKLSGLILQTFSFHVWHYILIRVKY